jgi:hypothetical protein
MYICWRRIKRSKICARWDDQEHGYKNFLEDVDEKPSPRHLFVRKDRKAAWSKTNYKWSLTVEYGPREEQFLVYKGRKFTREQLAAKARVAAGTFNARIRRGWSVTEAVRGMRATT